MSEKHKAIKLVVADDDPIYRDGLATLLGTYEDLEVKGIVGDGEQLLRLVVNREVDIVILDLDMPICDGISAARKLSQIAPSIKVIFLTAFQREELFSKTMGRNIKGFLTKNTSIKQLTEVIRQVHEGFTIFDSRPAEILIEQYCDTVTMQPEYQQFRNTIEAFPSYLRSVFGLLIKAKPNKQIAKELGLSESTVRSYVAEIFIRTNMESRGLLAITAVKAGY